MTLILLYISNYVSVTTRCVDSYTAKDCTTLSFSLSLIHFSVGSVCFVCVCVCVFFFSFFFFWGGGWGRGKGADMFHNP